MKNNELTAREQGRPALAFLKQHGHESIISAGCGVSINRIDNHLRLLSALNLKYYVRTLLKIRRYGLKPFRPWPIFPWENNIVLWRRRDFDQASEPGVRFKWLRRMGQSFIS